MGNVAGKTLYRPFLFYPLYLLGGFLKGFTQNPCLLYTSGLRSRVPFHLDFPDYSPAELLDIMLFMAASEELELSDEAAGKFLRIMGERVGQPDFSNAREVRNVLDQAKGELSRRLQTRRKVSRWDMKVITALDLGRGDPELLSSLETARKEMFRAPLDPGPRSAFASPVSYTHLDVYKRQ